MIIESKSAEYTQEIGRRLGATMGPGSVIALSGPLGAGKTVFTKGIASGLGVVSTITSPSFTIVVDHEGRIPLRHIDLYRTGSDEELELFGFDELTSQDCVTVIEWGEKAVSFLDENHVSVSIDIAPEGTRRLAIHAPGAVLGKIDPEAAK